LLGLALSPSLFLARRIVHALLSVNFADVLTCKPSHRSFCRAKSRTRIEKMVFWVSQQLFERRLLGSCRARDVELSRKQLLRESPAPSIRVDLRLTCAVSGVLSQCCVPIRVDLRLTCAVSVDRLFSDVSSRNSTSNADSCPIVFVPAPVTLSCSAELAGGCRTRRNQLRLRSVPNRARSSWWRFSRAPPQPISLPSP